MHGSQKRFSTIAKFRGQTQIPRTLTSEGPAQSQDCVGFVFCQYVLLQGRGRHNQKSTWDLGFSWFFGYCIVLYCIVLYCTVLSCIVLCKAGWLSGWLAGWLYCTVLYCAVLCCTVLYCTEPFPSESSLAKGCKQEVLITSRSFQSKDPTR